MFIKEVVRLNGLLSNIEIHDLAVGNEANQWSNGNDHSIDELNEQSSIFHIF